MLTSIARAISANIRGLGWDSSVELSSESIEELTWWNEALDEWDGKPLIVGQPDVLLCTDSSDYGWGAAILPATSSENETWGFWDKDQVLSV